MRERRLKSKKGIKEVAAGMGVSVSMLSLLERGLRSWNEQKAASYIDAINDVIK